MNADNLRVNITADVSKINQALAAVARDIEENQLRALFEGLYSAEPPRGSIPPSQIYASPEFKKESTPGTAIKDPTIGSVSIGPLCYKVQLVDELPKGEDGPLWSDTSDEQQTIKILKTLAHGQRRISLWYESLQTIYRVSGGDIGDLVDGQWQALAAGVLDALQRNAWLDGPYAQPDAITIGPICYKVLHIFELQDNGERLDGHVRNGLSTIELDADQEGQARRVTLWECILRAILMQAGHGHPWAIENTLTALAYGIVRLLKGGRIDTRL